MEQPDPIEFVNELGRKRNVVDMLIEKLIGAVSKAFCSIRSIMSSAPQPFN